MSLVTLYTLEKRVVASQTDEYETVDFVCVIPVSPSVIYICFTLAAISECQSVIVAVRAAVPFTLHVQPKTWPRQPVDAHVVQIYSSAADSVPLLYKSQQLRPVDLVATCSARPRLHNA